MRAIFVCLCPFPVNGKGLFLCKYVGIDPASVILIYYNRR